MATLGKMNKLPISRESDYGLYLNADTLGEVLLPTSLVPMGIMPYDELDVFIHCDSQDRLVATTQKPYVMVGTFAYVEVVDVDQRMGAFIDWGLAKDLLLPFREQTHRVRKGQGVVVTVFEDTKTKRLVATERISKYLNLTPPQYEFNEEVDLIIIDETELGYNAIINQKHKGLIYHSELSEALDYGSEMKGYIAKIRDDGKIDVRRDKTGAGRRKTMAEIIFQKLTEEGGFMPFNDHSDPSDVRKTFDMSKKAFKQGIGTLYRNRKIRIAEDGIHAVDSEQ